jgi:hypothetical protein
MTVEKGLAFQRLDLTGLPDVHELPHDRLRVLWILVAAKRAPALEWLSAAEISRIARDCCSLAIPRQRVAAILQKESSTVAKTKKNKVRMFKIMMSGEDLILSNARRILFIQPSQAFSGLKSIEELFQCLRGGVYVCDPYIDHQSLIVLATWQDVDKIMVLTENVHKEDRVRRDLRFFTQEYGDRLEMRLTSEGRLHDRYVIHEDGMILLGTSLNGLGKKQSFVVALGEDIREHVLSAFKRNWHTARVFG